MGSSFYIYVEFDTNIYMSIKLLHFRMKTLPHNESLM